MRKYWEILKRILRNDKELIYLTAALVVVGGLVRLFSYKLSVYVLNISFIPYLFMRGGYYITRRDRTWTLHEKQRFAVLIAMCVVILLNTFTIFRSEFLLFFLLMIDYILVINKRANQAPARYTDDNP